MFLIAASLVKSPWLVILRSPVVLVLLIWFWREYGELRDFRGTRPGHWVEGILAGAGVFMVWIALDSDWAVLSRSDGFSPTHADGRIDWRWAAPRLVGFSLVVPIMEELFWRSFLMRWIANHQFLSQEPARVGARALIVTSILFALEHEHWAAGFVAGLVYGGLYVRSGNLWVPVLAHAVTNAALGIWILATGNWAFW